MKANELRIGNFLTWEDNPYRLLIVNEIGYNNQKNRWVRFDNGDGSIIEDECSQLIPIPITNKWLKDFGFIYGSLQLKTPDKTLNISAIINGKYYMYLDDVFGNSFDLNYIEYVHQLQNLYFVLTGEELTVK